MDVMSPERRLFLENKKLLREIKRLKKGNEVLRLANEQALRTQASIRQYSLRQIFYTNQLLKTSPYILILTDARLRTVMTSDLFFRYSDRYSPEEIRRGIPLQTMMSGVLPSNDLVEFLEKCENALNQKLSPTYLLRTVVGGQKIDWQITINCMMTKDDFVAGLNILFVDTTEVIDAMERAETADKAKSAFLASMSHEIRTPMNSISGMAEFILRDSADKIARRHAAKIKSASRTLLTLINDILDFSKIESGKMQLVEDSYRLSSLLNDVMAMIDARLNNSSVKLKAELHGSIPDELYGDEIRIKQVLINLLGNAVKFTSRGSITLSVRGERLDDTACLLFFSVTDTGIGLRKEDIGRIFYSFTQVDMQKNRAVEGSGLGLAICKRLIAMMGGSLDVKSTYGKGSTFSFSIISTVENWRLLDPKDLTAREVTETAYRPSFCAPEANILVVDDNDMNLDVAEGLLTPYRIQVTRSTSGEDALQRFADNNRYDIIFMDHMMPGMDGVDTLLRLRRMEGGDKVIVIALTANALSGAAAEYKAWDFQDFLAKPIDPQLMDRILRKYLPKEKICFFEEHSETDRESEDLTLAKGQGSARQGPEQPEPPESQEPESESAPEGDYSLFIDEVAALKYCMGNRTFLKKMLGAFVRNDKSNEIEALYQKKDWPNYRIIVHSVKGNALTVGALQLSAHAKELEYAARDERIDEVEQKHGPFLKEYRAMLASIRGSVHEG